MSQSTGGIRQARDTAVSESSKYARDGGRGCHDQDFVYGQRIEYREKLSYEDFAKNYLYANKPVVITDALREWNAMRRWTPQFFKQQFGNMSFTLDEVLKDSFADKGNGNTAVEYTMDRFIERVLSSTEENPAPYFRNQILYDLFPSLKRDIEPLPEYFLPNWLSDHYMVKHVGEVLNRGAALELYIGGKGAAFPVLHYDGAAVHAFLMQVYGRKRIILYPPSQEKFLYPAPKKANLSLVNSVDNPDLEKFPLFAKAEPIVFILEPGEMLFMPSRWWHTTKMLSPSISISANVVNQSNWPELINFVARRKCNPLVAIGSRVYLTGAGWKRSWRDRSWKNRAQVHRVWPKPQLEDVGPSRDHWDYWRASHPPAVPRQNLIRAENGVIPRCDV